jgi:ABC-type sugar transport system permease subunit
MHIRFIALVLVFLQWDLVTAPSFAGFDNVRLLANDRRFWRAVGNTFVFLSITFHSRS